MAEINGKIIQVIGPVVGYRIRGRPSAGNL